MVNSAVTSTPFRHVLRSLGLSIFLDLAQSIRRYFQEPKRDPPAECPKRVIQKSRWRGIARCFVHVVPVLASTAIITLNLCHLFLGATFPGKIQDIDVSTAMLQVVAKIQELLILSSLATIVFHRICVELISDHGLPLGFLCSGFTFSQISYFWSPDFWGAFQSNVRWRRKGPTILLLVVTGVLAVTAGPSVAVLIIPRNQSWDAGGSDFFLRGTEDQLFPSVVNSSSLDAPPECWGQDAVRYGYCPAGGFNALKNYVSQVSIINNGENLQDPLPKKLFGVFSEQYIDVASITRGMPVSKLVGSVQGVACQTAVVASFLPAVMYQKKILNDWETIIGNIPWTTASMSTAEYRYFSGTPSTMTWIHIPAVRTACSAAQPLAGDDLDVLFPVIPSASCPIGVQKIHNVPQLEGSVPSTSLRTTWIPLPQDFGDGAASAGLLFEAPWSRDNSSRIVIGCTVDARWVDGAVESGRGNPKSLADGRKWGQKADLTTPFRPLTDGSWDKITLDESWLRLLTPIAAAQDVSGNVSTRAQNTFEALLATSAISDGLTDTHQANKWDSPARDLANRTIYLEWLTTLLIADGLSRYGSHMALNRSGAPTSWDILDYVKTTGNFDDEILRGGRALFPPYDTKYTTYKAKIAIQGLSYLAHSTTDWLSMAVLFIHILLALIHTGYILVCGKSSTAWESIPELLTLTLNSRPPPLGHRRNTSAGIHCLKTFSKLFVIRSTRVETDDASTQDEARKPTGENKPVRHVELIVRDSTHPTESKADGNPSGEAEEGVSRRQPSLLPNFAWPFAPDRVPYPDRQHELHWGPGSPALRDPMAISSKLTQKQSWSSSSLSSSSSSRKGSSQIRHRVLGTMDNDGVLFEKIVPNQEYA